MMQSSSSVVNGEKRKRECNIIWCFSSYKMIICLGVMERHKEMLSMAIKYMDEMNELESKKFSQIDALLLNAADIQIPGGIGKNILVVKPLEFQNFNLVTNFKLNCRRWSVCVWSINRLDIKLW